MPGKSVKLALIILSALYFTVNILQPKVKDYLSVNELIMSLGLKAKYDHALGILIISKDNDSVKIMTDSPYIMIGSKKTFIGDFVRSEQGQIYIPEKAALMINSYFSKRSVEIRKPTSKKIPPDNKNYLLNNIQSAIVQKETVKESIIINNKKEPVDEKISDEIETKDRYIYEKEPEKVSINAIIIDPGHGGTDPGAVGYSGIKEKDIVLRASLILAEKLKRNFPDKKIILTRDSDVFVPLEKRAKIANYVFNKYGSTLFISVHVNASRSSKSYGFETWYLVEEYRRNIIKKGEISKDSDVESVLNSMLNDEIYKESKELAQKIQNNMQKEIGDISMNRGIKEQTYFVIKKSIMPAVLVEIGFNTNKNEEIRLTKYSYLNKIANGILSGIKEFIEIYEKTSGYTK